ncbi:MAG: 50S ribosomal protein L17 [Bacteroidales bacterium]|nr:50S ribosomal protein L17 [Bacteroidales bacterium]
MRHRKKVNHLGRKSAHRKAMLSNMAASLILHKRINTTVAKAKALKVYVEPLITKSKDDSTHSRRVVFSYLENKHAVSELFREVAQKVADRPGGYTRILKTGFRMGDGAEMCMIELVDYNPNLLKKAEGDQAKKTRRAGRRKKTEDDAPVAKQAAPKAEKEEKPAEEPKIEEPKAEEVQVQPEAQATDATEDQTTPEETKDADTEK